MTLFPYTFPWLSLFYLFNLSWPKCGGYETLQTNASWLISSPRKLTGIAHIFHHRYSIFNSFYAVHLCCGGSKLRRDIQMSFSPATSSNSLQGDPWVFLGQMGYVFPPVSSIVERWVCPKVAFWLDMSGITSQEVLPGCLLIRFQNHIK